MTKTRPEPPPLDPVAIDIISSSLAPLCDPDIDQDHHDQDHYDQDTDPVVGSAH